VEQTVSGHTAGGATTRAVITFVCEPTDVGERVDVVVARRTGRARAAVQEAVRAGVVTVGGRRVRPSHRLGRGDVVAGRVPEAEVEEPSAENIALDIRYSDERVLVVSKPAGLVVHPAGGHRSGTLVNALLALGTPLAGASTPRPGIVHRLDKDTSGLLLVARDDAALAFLQEALLARMVERRYVTLVRGAMPAATGTIEAPIGRHPRAARLQSVVPSGKHSVTHYRVLDRAQGATLVEARLETGRTHQIRVHLSHIGHPVLGDRVYGGAAELAAELGLARPFLHAFYLAWPSPQDSSRIEVVDPLPPELAGVLARARLSWTPSPGA
jgi:23S rRNA pseudouridine1911/1915/1917 synthase